MSDSSDSSPKRKDRSRSEEKPSSGKLFITNLDGKVTSYLLRPNSKIFKISSEGSFKKLVQLLTLLPNATVILNTASHLLT